MNGHLILDTPIAVDFWNIRKCGRANIFLLSHIHSDHMVGLTSSWSRPIYCSKVTGDLLCHKVSLSKDLIRPLELDSPTLIPLNPSHSEMVTVTAIDANHCPGSVIFLFQGYFGTILYTGDFRYSSKMFVDSPLSNISVDVLYLDNTYCDPLCTFGAREEATEAIFDIIKSYPENDILLGMQSIGKPDLLVNIANTFQEYIGVPPSMYEYLKILEVPNVFEVDSIEHECRIRVVPAYFISKKLFSKLTRPTIAILATALYEGLEGAPYSNQPSVHVVPYSDHSSYVELQEFVKRVEPGRIVPIVGRETKGPFNISFAKRADMSCFDHFLSKRPQEAFKIPAGVDVTEAHNVCQSEAVWSSSKRRKRSLSATATKSITPKGVVFESSPQRSKNKLNVQKNVAKSPDDSSDPSSPPVIETVGPNATSSGLKTPWTPEKTTHIPNSNNDLAPRANTPNLNPDSCSSDPSRSTVIETTDRNATNSGVKKRWTPEKTVRISLERLRSLKETVRICMKEPCPPEKSTHIPNSNNDLAPQANTANLNPDSSSGPNILNTSQKTDLNILKDGITENEPGLPPIHNGSESGRNHHPREKVSDNHPSQTRVQESARTSEVDENCEKDTSSTSSSGISTVYSVQPTVQFVKLNDVVSVHPQIPMRKRKLPPMFDEEFNSANKRQRQCSDYWVSDTGRTEKSTKETLTKETLTKETLTQEILTPLTQETLTKEKLTKGTLTKETLTQEILTPLTQETLTRETLTQETLTKKTLTKETSLLGSVCDVEKAHNGENDLEGANEVTTDVISVKSQYFSTGRHPSSGTRRTETSTKEIRCVCDGERSHNGEAEMEGENAVPTDVISVKSRYFSTGRRPSSSFLSKPCRPQVKSVFTSSISDYVGRFDDPVWTFEYCQKVFSNFVKKQRLMYSEEP